MRISDWSSDVCSSDLTYSDLAPGEGHSYGRQIGISNDTSVDLGGFTIRNIFGFRKNRKDEAINTGANGPLSITIDGVTSPFILFHGSAVEERKYITAEPIGKAACRESVWKYQYISVVARNVKNKNINKKI